MILKSICDAFCINKVRKGYIPGLICVFFGGEGE